MEPDTVSPGTPRYEEYTASRADGTDNGPQPSAASLAMAWVLWAQQEGAQLLPGLEWLPGALLQVAGRSAPAASEAMLQEARAQAQQWRRVCLKAVVFPSAWGMSREWPDPSSLGRRTARNE